MVPENNEDVLYIMVRRTIGGAYHRFIERLEQRDIFNFATDSFFVDCGLSYSGAPVFTFSGLDHLEGQQVACLADGVVIANGHRGRRRDPNYLVVSGGSVTLPGGTARRATRWSTSACRSPTRRSRRSSSTSRARPYATRRRRSRAWRCCSTRARATSRSGPTSDNLVPYKLTPYEGTSSPWTGRAEQSIITTYNESGRILVRQVDPVPLTILSMMPHVEVGG